MFGSARAWMMSLVLAAGALAGCVQGGELAPAAAVDLDDVLGVLPIEVANVMTFTQSFVTPAVGLAADLYEPTMEVSDTGTIYVAGHVIGAATTGTPAYYSNDDGATWAPLPFLASLQTPSPLQGSQPPPGDEGFIVAGENGQAWMADIYLAGFSITGWCDNGATQCYDNRQAYDRAGATAAGCHELNLNDRPWAAYASGTIFLVNNPGGGAMQIGVMDVPTQPAGIGGGMASVNGPTWNFCASEGGGIPGIPAMRADGLFAVPQMFSASPDSVPVMNVVIGNKADIFAVETKVAFPVTSWGAGTINVGQVTFDLDGTLFAAARNNTRVNETPFSDPIFGEGTTWDVGDGQFIIALSQDDGQTFQNATFRATSPVQSVYIDGNMAGPGALLTWSQVGETEGKADWYVAHVHVGADGKPELRNVTLAVDEGEPYSAHVTGAAAGPDGRAYFLNFKDGAPAEYAGSVPMSVWIQQDGPTLPVRASS